MAHRTARARRAALLLAALLTGAPAGGPPALAEGIGVAAAGFLARLGFHDGRGNPLEAPVAGRRTNLAITLTDAITGAPSTGLYPASWIRPRQAGDVECEAAGRAFRATRRLPFGTIDLNGIVIGASYADGAFNLVDPQFDLATANIVRAQRLEGPPAQVIGVNEAQRFLARFPQSGRLLAIDAHDGTTRTINGGGAPLDLAPGRGGFAWVADGATGSAIRLDLGTGRPAEARLVGPDPRFDRGRAGALAAWSPAGRALLLDRESGRTMLDLHRSRLHAVAVVPETPAEAPIPAFPVPTALALLNGTLLEIVWLDAPDHPTTVELGASADRLLAGPDGRLIYAVDLRAGVVAVVDLSVAAVVAVEALGRPAADAAVTAAAFFLLAADGSQAMVLSATALRSGEEPWRRDAHLGPPDPQAFVGEGRLVALDPAPRVLAVNAPVRAAFPIMEEVAFGNMPPPTGIPLKGGEPHSIAIVDRALRETAPGRFETAVALGPGAWELVFTAGIGGQTVCIPFAVPGAPAPSRSPSFVAELIEPADGRTGAGSVRVALSIRVGGGPYSREETPVTVSALSSGWRFRTTARRAGNGLYEAQFDPPRAGFYSITPDVPNLTEGRNLILEVTSQ